MPSNSFSVRALLWWGCLLSALAALAVGAIGVAGVRTTASTGQRVASDEFATLHLTAQFSSQVKDLQLGVQALALSQDRGQRTLLGDALANVQLPACEAQLVALEQAHAQDDAAEKAELATLLARWSRVRALLNASRRGPEDVPDAAEIERLRSAFGPLDAQITLMAGREQTDAAREQAATVALLRRSEAAVLAAALAAALAAGGFGWLANRRFRRAAEPARHQSEFTDALQLTESEEEAHTLLHRHLERVVSGSQVAVLNRNNSADRLEAVAAIAPASPLRAGLLHAEPRSCLAVRSGSTHEEDNRGLLACSVCCGFPGRSVCTPLTVGGEVIGSVLVNRDGAYDAGDRQRIRDSVSQAAPVLANLRNLALAEQRAATDALTGLPNKRSVADTIKRMLAAGSRTSSPACLLMLDLDHFRDINERFGHPAGDQALANVGATIRSTLRESDFAGRNGGEEFVVVLPDTDLAGGVRTAEALREAVAQISLPGVDLVVTVSIGVAAYPDHATSAERLERSADAALYVAKRSGRNRVEVASRPPELLPDPGPAPVATNGASAVHV